MADNQGTGRKLTPEQLEQLAELEKQVPPRASGVRGLMTNIHRTPELRSILPLEAMSLMPVPLATMGKWQLFTLLVIPFVENGVTVRMSAPFCAVLWDWPEEKVSEVIELRRREDLRHLFTSNVYEWEPPGSPLNPVERAVREDSLISSLEEMLLRPPSHDEILRQNLAPHYASLLPRAAYPFYRALVPSSSDWLLEDVAPPTLGQLEAARTGDGAPLSEDSSARPNKRPTVGEGIEAAPDSTSARRKSANKPLPDLTENVSEWLNRARTLTHEFDLRDIETELDMIEQLRAAPGCRLAFVGDAKTGKSYLINRLLGAEVALETSLPTGGWATRLQPARHTGMDIDWPEGTKQRFKLDDPDRWEQLMAREGDEAKAESRPVANISVNSPWLERIGVTILEPPGLNRSAQTDAFIDLFLRRADAMIFVLSAARLITRQERSFLLDQISSRRFARILAVVTGFDNIQAHERPTVFERIKARMAEISPEIKVLPLHPVDESGEEEQTVEEIRRHIEEIIPREDRLALRSQRIAASLARQFAAMVEFGKAALEQSHRSADQRRLALIDEEKKALRTRSQLDGLIEHWDERQTSRVESLRQMLREEKDEFFTQLVNDLRANSSPKLWWEHRLPSLLQQHRSSINQKYASGAANRVLKDYRELKAALEKHFGFALPEPEERPLAVPKPGFKAMSSVYLEDDEETFSDKLRALFLGPGGEWRFKKVMDILSPKEKRKEDQRSYLEEHLSELVDSLMSLYTTHLASQMSELYQSLALTVQREWEAAEQRRREALQAVTSDSSEADWNRLIERADASLREINQALQ